MSLLKAIGVKHSGKEKVKLHFDINIQKVSNLIEFNNKPVYLVWKRGSRKNSGRVKDVVAVNGEAVWNEKIVLKCTLFKDHESGKFDEKILSLALKLGDGKTIGKMDIDLGHFAKHEALHLSEIAFSSSKKRGAPTLHVAIQSRWVKMNDKLLVRQPATVPEENTPGTAQGHTPVVDIDGQSYSLKTEEVATTDGSLDSTTGGSWDDEEGEKEDVFVSTSMYEAEVKRVHEEAEGLRKQLRLVEGESEQRVKTIELQERELLGLRQKLEIMESKCIEHEELIQRAYGLEAFMQQQLALARQGYEDSVKVLKKELAVLEKKQDEGDGAPHVEVNNKVVEVQTVSTIKRDSECQTSGIPPERLAERDQLVRRVEALHLELDRSAQSFILITTQLAEKEKRMRELVVHNQTLQQQLDAALLPTPTFPSTSSSTSPPSCTESKEITLSPVPYKPLPPLFSNPIIDNHYPLIIVLVFLILLSLPSAIRSLLGVLLQ